MLISIQINIYVYRHGINYMIYFCKGVFTLTPIHTNTHTDRPELWIHGDANN